jgi:hypothetical protein
MNRVNEVYVYVNVNHSAVANFWESVCPNKKAAGPEGAAALADAKWAYL